MSDLNAIIFTGNFQYGVAFNFLSDLAIELSKLNVNPIFFNTDNFTDDKTRLIELFRLSNNKKISIIISVNGIGLNYVASFEHLKTTACFSWLLDHPLHHFHRFSAYRDKVHLLCVDRTHTKWLQQRGFAASDFLHAVKLTNEQSTATLTDIGLLFPASYFDESQHISGLQVVHPKMVDILQSPSVQNINDVEMLLGIGQDKTDIQKLPDANTQNFLRLADFYLRGKSRNQLVQDCADAGIELVIAGTGWERSGFANLHILLGPLPYTELPSWIRRSQFVLHHNPGFVEGLHERLLLALSCGTAVLTKQQLYLHQQFSPEDGVYGFSCVAELNKLPLDTHVGSNISQSSALQQHSFNNRARQLLAQCLI